MTMFKRGVLLASIAALVLYSCGLDGGSRGTGVSALVSGNVASVQTSSGAVSLRDRNSAPFANPVNLFHPRGADAASPVQGITVTVEGNSIPGATDSAGLFSVRGPFDGPVTVLFTRAQDALRATMMIDIPAGGALTLNDVRINGATGMATADSQDVDFLGDIVQINCTSQTLVMISSRHLPGDAYTYTVRLDTSSVVDLQGHPLTCADLRNGQLAHLQGTVNADGTFGHALIVVDD